MLKSMNWYDWLSMADTYAKAMSGCTKVQVGAVIVKDNRAIGFGANRAIPDLCRYRGCLRVELYGDNDKTHRSPTDCRAIHSEIDAICNAVERVDGASIYITRYPCEACARAIVAAGITRVYYGREQEISKVTQQIFNTADVRVVHVKDWIAPDKTN